MNGRSGAAAQGAVFAWDALGPAEPIEPRPRIGALTARSVMLAVLMRSHDRSLPVHSLVLSAALFGVSEGTVRVALSRMSADGDVEAEGGRYRLSDRLFERQVRLDRTHEAALVPWDGTWELAIALPPVQSAGERAALRSQMKALLLTALRPGVFARPRNLERRWPDSVMTKFAKLTATPDFPAVQMPAFVRCLWDLEGFDRAARYLLGEMDAAKEPPERFVVAAAMAILLQEDPLLPPELLDDSWPGPLLRQTYAGYRREFDVLLQREGLLGN